MKTNRPIAFLLAILGGAGCLTGPSSGAQGGGWDYLPKCGGFGPPVSGLDFVGGQANTVVMSVGEERAITLLVSRPAQVVVSKDCPDRVQGAAFREITWSIEDLGIIHIGPPVGVRVLSLDPPSKGQVGGWGDTPQPRVVFIARGLRPGRVSLGVGAYLGPNKTGDWALAILTFNVK